LDLFLAGACNHSIVLCQSNQRHFEHKDTIGGCQQWVTSSLASPRGCRSWAWIQWFKPSLTLTWIQLRKRWSHWAFKYFCQ